MMSALFLISSFLFCQDIDAEQRQDHQYNGGFRHQRILFFLFHTIFPSWPDIFIRYQELMSFAYSLS